MWFNRRGGFESLMLCGVLLILGNVLYAIGWNEWALVSARFIIGVGAANVSVARAYLGVVTPQEERTGVFAMFAAMQGIGFVVGPAMGAALARVDVKIHVGGSLYPGGVYKLDGATAAGWLSALLCMINLVLIAVWFTDVPAEQQTRFKNTLSSGKDDRVYDTLDASLAAAHDDEVPRAIPNRPTTPTTSVPEPKRTDVIPARTSCTSVDKTVDLLSVVVCMLIFFLVICVFAVFETILSKIVDYLYDWKTEKAAILFVACGVISIFAFAAIKPLAKRISDRAVLALGLVGMIGAGAFCLDFKNDNIPLWRFLIAQALFSVGYPWASAILYALFSKILGDTQQGTMIGILTAAGSLARTLGPLAAGYGFYYGRTKAVYLLIGGCATLALILTGLFWNKLQDYEVLLLRIISKHTRSMQSKLVIQ